MSKVVEFKVGMTCGGCANAVNRILTKIPGNKYIISYNLVLIRIMYHLIM